MFNSFFVCLKCSHLFNTLDARGAVSVNERMAMILEVRDLACAVAGAYVGADPADAQGDAQ